MAAAGPPLLSQQHARDRAGAEPEGATMWLLVLVQRGG